MLELSEARFEGRTCFRAWHNSPDCVPLKLQFVARRVIAVRIRLFIFKYLGAIFRFWSAVEAGDLHRLKYGISHGKGGFPLAVAIFWLCSAWA